MCAGNRHFGIRCTCCRNIIIIAARIRMTSCTKGVIGLGSSCVRHSSNCDVGCAVLDNFCNAAVKCSYIMAGCTLFPCWRILPFVCVFAKTIACQIRSCHMALDTLYGCSGYSAVAGHKWEGHRLITMNSTLEANNSKIAARSIAWKFFTHMYLVYK